MTLCYAITCPFVQNGKEWIYVMPLHALLYKMARNEFFIFKTFVPKILLFLKKGLVTLSSVGPKVCNFFVYRVRELIFSQVTPRGPHPKIGGSGGLQGHFEKLTFLLRRIEFFSVFLLSDLIGGCGENFSSLAPLEVG